MKIVGVFISLNFFQIPNHDFSASIIQFEKHWSLDTSYFVAFENLVPLNQISQIDWLVISIVVSDYTLKYPFPDFYNINLLRNDAEFIRLTKPEVQSNANTHVSVDVCYDTTHFLPIHQHVVWVLQLKLVYAI